MTKIDISSTAIEKLLDIAKGFAESLIYPPAEEIGLLLREGISNWRFNNQIKTLVKSKAICEKHGVNPKVISPKLLCPLLDYASLEDNDKLLDKWATLLANMVDSDQNIENHVFPYLLSQLSIQEFETIELTVQDKHDRVTTLTNELEQHTKINEPVVIKLKQDIINLERELAQRQKNNINNPKNYQNTGGIQNDISKIHFQIRTIERENNQIKINLAKPELISPNNLRDFEISNLVRLGIAKEIVNSYGYVEDTKVTIYRNTSPFASDDAVDLSNVSVKIETDTVEYELTELGELFVKACQEKKTTPIA